MIHHANLIVGPREAAYALIPQDDREEGPDVTVLTYERMSIADARALIQNSFQKPVARDYRTYILFIESILSDAQNALLKLFEEPSAHVVFYCVIPREDILIPTLRSRFHLFGIAPQSKTGHTILDVVFKASPGERLALVAEKLKNEDTTWVEQLLSELEIYVSSIRDAVLMRELLTVLLYIHDAGASKKMLLEHLILLLPKEKGVR